MNTNSPLKIFIIIITTVILSIASFVAGVWMIGDIQPRQIVNNNLGVDQVVDDTQEEEIDTSDWQTYRNEGWGIEMKHPVGYKIDASQTGVRIYDVKRDSGRLEDAFAGGSVSTGVINKTLQEYIDELNAFDPPYSNIQNQEEIILGGVIATKLSGSNALGIRWIDIYATKNDMNYVISYNDGDQDIQQKMVSTFKFTEPFPAPNKIVVSDWQTYRNEEYGFEFKFPKNWTNIKESQQSIRLFNDVPNKSSARIAIVFKNTEGLDLDINDIIQHHADNKYQVDYVGSSCHYTFDINNAKIIQLDKEVEGKKYGPHCVSGGQSQVEILYTTYNASFFFEYKNNIYTFNLNTNYSDPENNDGVKIFDKIISTIKFIEPTTPTDEIDTSDWKVYEDKELGISFKYPPKWGEVIKKVENDFDEDYRYIQIYFSIDVTPRAFAITLTKPNSKVTDLRMLDIWSGFTGKKEDFICKSESISKDDILNCSQRLSSLPTISYYIMKRYPNSSFIQTTKHYKILPDDIEYKGIAIDVNIKTLNSYIPFDVVSEDITNFYNEYKTDVPQRLNEDEEVILEIEELDRFVESFAF